uniref:RRM domain-containing protein n=1 Tax=Schistosoma mansoni TaxID=6183 RepID=A0A5K4FDS9_SCHMA
MEVITSDDQNMLNNPLSQVKKAKQERQDVADTEIPLANYYPQPHESPSSYNFQQTGYPFCTISTSTTPLPLPTSSTSSSPNSTTFARSSSTSLPNKSLSQPTNYGLNGPDCLVVLDICTSGRQYDETGSDEYPIMLLTAKIYQLKQNDNSLDFQQGGAEFQQFIKPCQITYHDSKEFSLSKIKQPYVKLESDEIYPQDNNGSSITDRIIQSDVNGENYSVKIIGPTEECQKVTSVNTQILTEAPLLEKALKDFNQWIQDNNLYCFQNDHSTVNGRHLDQNSSPFCCSTANSRTTINTNSTTTEKMECDENLKSFILLVDGPYGLRLTLHPETTIKSIDITNYPYFYQFIDIKKSFAKFYKLATIPNTINEMMEYLQIDDDYSPPYSTIQHKESFLLKSQLEKIDNHYEYQYCNSEIQLPRNIATTTNLSQDHLISSTIQEPHTSNQDYQQFNSKLIGLKRQPGYWPIQHCRILVKVIQKMTLDGMEWTEFETVNREYYPAIISKTDTINDNVVVRARGLPWQATDLEIFQFFSGINIAKGGISLVLSKIGRRNGEALIQFADAEQQSLALRKHKHHVGKRYIEVYAATGSDFISIAGGESQEAMNFLGKLTTPNQTLIRMRGLPYTTTPEQIISFFANINCSVQFNANGILFVNKPDGRATGDAFVIFETKIVAEKALENNKQHIGSRYIELFKSTPAEVNQVMNSILSSTCEEQIHCWNNHLTECNNSVFTANNSSVYMPHFTETNNNLIYSDYNLKLLSNPSTIPEFTYSPHLISVINSNTSFINDISQYQPPSQQQNLSFSLAPNISQNGNSYFQRVLSNTNMNNSVTNILPTDSSNHFNSLDMLNNFISFINTPTTLTNIFTPNQLTTNQPCGRPNATVRSLNTAAAIVANNNNFSSTLVLPRFPINSIPITINGVNVNINSSNNSSCGNTSSTSGSNVRINNTIPITNNIDSQFIIPDLTNSQLFQIFGPNLMMKITSATTTTTTTVTTTIAATTTTTSSSTNTTDDIGSSSSDNNKNKINENLLLNINLSMEQITKTFVRICGMPINADITDILLFLQDNWRNVALHGIHLVYDMMGQPIGEAMIQFVTELSAQTVCEQKHKSIFIKYGLPIPVGAYVDVIQCTREDLNHLLSNMSRNIGIFTNNLISSSSTSTLSNLMNPIILTQLHNLDDITTMLKSSIPLQSGYGIEQTNFLHIKTPEFRLNPFISNEELSNFNVLPPTLPNLPNYITGINSTFSFPTPLIDNNITNALIQCTPPLSNMLGFQIPNLIYQTSFPNFFTNNSLLNNHESTELLSTSIPYLTNCHKNKNNNISNGYNLPEFEGNSDWANSWSNNHKAEQITIMNSPEMQVFKTNDLVASKTENKPIIVTVQGFPKEMTPNDFTKWLEKKINNVKILSVQFEHSLLNEISNGFAKVYLQHNSDAELIVQEFNNTTLNNSRISAQIN